MLEHTLFLTQLQEMQFTPSHIHSCITHYFKQGITHLHTRNSTRDKKNDRMKKRIIKMYVLLYKQNKVTTIYT